jgi:hypothetical protein
MTKFKLANDATLVSASDCPGDAPRNLRLIFSRAVETRRLLPAFGSRTLF